MAINTKVDVDLNQDQMAARILDLKPKGFRLLSLSMYGDPLDARYAAVWSKRAGPDWDFALGFTVQDLGKVDHDNRNRDFYPRFVTATGKGSPHCRMSAIFERLDPPKTREITLEMSPALFANEVANRRRDGWILMSGTIYDDLNSDPIITAIWARNSANVAWTAMVSENDELQDHTIAQLSGWARLAFITTSTQRRFLSVFRDDHIGPIGKGFFAEGLMSREQLESKLPIWQKDGFHPACLHGSAAGSKSSFVVLGVNSEKIVPRVERTSGGPGVHLIDKAVFDLMKQSNIRGAALAIVKGTKLVLARGYTWAEPDYPDVLPTTVFRLGSVSKVITALAIHQLVAQGRIKLSDKVKEVLPLTPPNKLKAVNTRYLEDRVRHLIETHKNVSPSYANHGATVEIAEQFKNKFPVTHEQIARVWITKPVEPGGALDDFGYFLAGQIVKTRRNHDINLPMISAAGLITTKLQINKPPTERVRVARSRLLDQESDDARYHSRDLFLNRSVMSGNTKHFGPLVPRGYGAENLELIEASGGLTAAVVDLARIMAAMNVEPYSPLGSPAVKSMLKNAIDKNGGHGFDNVEEFGAGSGKFAFRKGGLLETTQAGLYYSQDGCSYVVVWNGLHTGTGGDENGDIVKKWYPKFEDVLFVANLRSWAADDLFNQFDMDTFSPTEDNFHWCKKCQGLFQGGTGGICPKPVPNNALKSHDASKSENYVLMHSAALPYGQPDWRVCKTCKVLFFDGSGSSPSKCPATAKKHQHLSKNYSLVKDSPFDEHQTDWHRCKNCQALFFQGKNASFCPGGGAHEDAKSGEYSLAFKK